MPLNLAGEVPAGHIRKKRAVRLCRYGPKGGSADQGGQLGKDPPERKTTTYDPSMYMVLVDQKVIPYEGVQMNHHVPACGRAPPARPL